MCGIFGLINLNGSVAIDERRFARALMMLLHRGPDAQSFQPFGNDAILGHTRLSIIDLAEENNQPLSILDRYWVVYNGEMFNFTELRKELEQLGARFRTEGDTEVLLYSYAFWGTDCVTRFNGMWAFAIYDTEEKILFCSRDRFGEKPFNYTVSQGQFMFASETKAMLAYRPELAEVEYNAISNYCRTSVGAQNPQTWFKDVQRLQPGHNLIVHNGQIKIERYWHYPTEIDSRITFEEARERYAELFKDAVRLRMRSDVPLGITLSSGVDSSSIAYAMGEIAPSSHHCFTAKFHEKDRLETNPSIYKQKLAIDESISARAIAQDLGYMSHSIDTKFMSILPELERIIFYLESGHSSPAIIPLMQLLGQARKFVTVIMDGQGADELLGGYTLNTIFPAVADLVRRGLIAEAMRSLRDFAGTYQLSYAAKMTLRTMSNDIEAISCVHQLASGVDRVFGPRLREHIRWKDYMELPGESNSSLLGTTLLRQHSGGLINLLHYGDAISMANGMEARMPFLDYRLVEFSWRLPAEFKVKGGVGKVLHRQAMRGLVPNHILDQAIKYGFNTPISQVLRDQPEILEVLTEQRCTQRGLFERRGLEALIQNYRSGRRDHSTLLFRLLSTELWFRRFIDVPIELPVAAPSGRRKSYLTAS